MTFEFHVQFAVPAVPMLTSAIRLNGSSAMIKWIPLTPDKARGLLTSLRIAYEPTRGSRCFNLSFTESNVVSVRDNLFEQATANITGLEPNHEYCVAIQASTSGGDSGFSNRVNLPCTRNYSYPLYKHSHNNELLVHVVPRRVPFQLKFGIPDDVKCSNFVVSRCTIKGFL